MSPKKEFKQWVAGIAGVLLLASTCAAFGAATTQALAGGAGTLLTSFDDLYGALSSGSSVRAISNYSQCFDMATGLPADESRAVNGPRAVGGTTIGTFEAFFDPRFGPVPFLAYSDSTLIQNYQGSGYFQIVLSPLE